MRNAVELSAVCSSKNIQDVPVDNVRFLNNIVWALPAVEPVGVRKGFRWSVTNVVFQNNVCVERNPSKKGFRRFKYNIDATNRISNVRNCESEKNLIDIDKEMAVFADPNTSASANFALTAQSQLWDSGNCGLALSLLRDYAGSARKQDFDSDGKIVVDPGASRFHLMKRTKGWRVL